MIQHFLPTRAATVQSLGHPAAGVIGWHDTTSNTSGVAVTPETALTFSAVWCAVRVISETLATLPCLLYRRTSDDGRERATDDKRYEMIRDRPHPMMSAVNFFETMTASMVLRGNCYAKIIRNQMGDVTRLELQHPDNVQPPIMDGEDHAIYRLNDPQEDIRDDDMLHIAGLGGDGISGWSVIKYGQQSIGGGLAGDQYAAAQMGNGATPKGVLKFPTRLDDDARRKFRKAWNEEHQGSGKAGNIAILHGGMDYQAISMTNEDAQLLQSRQYSVRDIARWFRLPPHMLADLADSSVRANIEQQAMEFITYSMMPWLTRWQQALNTKLLTEEERQAGMYFEFLLDSLLRGDVPSRFTAYATARQWGWLSVNDIRKRENLNLIDGGDVYLQPSNMVPADSDMARGEKPDPPVQSFGPPGPPQPKPASGDEEEEDEEEPDPPKATGWLAGKRSLIEACNVLVRDRAAWLLTKERAEITKHAAMVVRGTNFLDWMDKWYAEHQETMTSRLQAAVRCMSAVVEPEQDIAAKLARRYCDKHKQQLLAATDGDRDTFASRVQDILSGWQSDVDQMELKERKHVA